MSRFQRLFICFLSFQALVGCGGGSTSDNNSGSNNQSNNQNVVTKLDSELRTLINQHDLTGDPAFSLNMQGKIPSVLSPKAQLGKKLFYSKMLSGTKTVACASCHHPVLGGGDNLSMSIGVQAVEPDVLGEGRITQNNEFTDVARNVPSSFNTIFLQETIFHDGRLHVVNNGAQQGFHTPDVALGEIDLLADKDILHAQNRFPVASVEEMRGDFGEDLNNHELRELLVDRFKNKATDEFTQEQRDYWLEAFRQGYQDYVSNTDDLITVDKTFDALSEFIRSQVFINNQWQSYVKGNTHAISESAKRGAKLFYAKRNNGGFNCVSCHKGDYFTDEGFYNVGIPQIGIGKGDGLSDSNDYGREGFTKDVFDRFKFRTPTLLNVEMTGPWGHDGAYTSFESVVRHMLAPRISASHYDSSQVTQSGAKLDDVLENTLENINNHRIDIDDSSYTEEQLGDLIAFLKTLTDPCVKSRQCLSPWIPVLEDSDPMGFQLNAVGADGNLL